VHEVGAVIVAAACGEAQPLQPQEQGLQGGLQREVSHVGAGLSQAAPHSMCVEWGRYSVLSLRLAMLQGGLQREVSHVGAGLSQAAPLSRRAPASVCCTSIPQAFDTPLYGGAQGQKRACCLTHTWTSEARGICQDMRSLAWPSYTRKPCSMVRYNGWSASA